MAQKIESSRDVVHGDKDVPWYHTTPEEFSPAARELLEKYSNVPADRVDAHVFDAVNFSLLRA